MQRKKLLSFMLVFALIVTMVLGNSMVMLASNVIYEDDFSGATTSNLFTAGYKSLPSDSSKPMYIKTGGTVTAGSNAITLDAGRMTIGALSGSSTSSNSTPGGVLNLNQGYRVLLDISSVEGTSSKKFQVYVDNNTTSQGNSVHGGNSKVYEETIGNLNTGTLVIEPNVGTQASFIQLRTESGASVTIRNVRIEYLNESGDPIPDPEDPQPEDPTPNPNPNPMDVIYVAPNASSNGAGTIDNPMAFTEAITRLTADGVIYMRGGRYHYDDQINIEYGNNGTANAMKSIIAFESEKPVLDFSSQPYDSKNVGNNPRGLQVNGDYWYIKGIEFYGAADNGLFISGNHNIIDQCIANANRDTGIQLGRRNSNLSNIADWPSYNLILNTTSFDNADPDNYEDADGFAAKLTTGPGNVFDGCIAYNNVDDGWDLFTKTDTGPIGSVTIKNSVAFNNGVTTSGVYGSGSDGNGFKLGGSNIAVDHYVYNSVAFNNKAHGFTDNSNPGTITIVNSTSFDNSVDKAGAKSNFDFARHSNSDNVFVNLLSFTTTIGQTASDKFRGTGMKSVFYNSKKYYRIDEEMYVDHSSGVTRGTEISVPSTNEFLSISPPSLNNVHELLRNDDGTVNLGDFLKLAPNSQFKGIGVDGKDLGAIW
jgi:hypothetical protein